MPPRRTLTAIPGIALYPLPCSPCNHWAEREGIRSRFASSCVRLAWRRAFASTRGRVDRRGALPASRIAGRHPDPSSVRPRVGSPLHLACPTAQPQSKGRARSTDHRKMQRGRVLVVNLAGCQAGHCAISHRRGVRFRTGASETAQDSKRYTDEARTSEIRRSTERVPELGVEPEAPHAPQQLRAAEPQRGGGPRLVAVRAPERFRDHLLLHLGQGVHIGPGCALRRRPRRDRSVGRRSRGDAELPGRDQLPGGEDERSLDGVLQLTDVAGPPVRLEQIARLAAQAGFRLAHLGAQRW